MHNFYYPNPLTYQQAKKLLENDELVAFPTETIYGLGANACSDIATKKIFQLKGRPSDNPLIVHLGDKRQISKYANIENEIQQVIVDKLMPGPLTLLLQKKEYLISSVVCAVKYVGIRIPSNIIAQDLLQTVQLPIAAPSANLSGKPSPTNAQMVYDNVGDTIPMIIDGGESETGIESSVVQVVEEHNTYKIQILRPGFITKEDLEELFNHEIRVEYTTNNPELSPGMRYKHYSITGKVVVLDSVPGVITGETQKIGYLITQEFFDTHQSFFSALKQNTTFIKIRGTHKNLSTCAHNLFDFYHYFDQHHVDILYVEKLPEIGIGYALMNRVRRSAE